MNDIKIISDKTENGVRVIQAATCQTVCSKAIAAAIKDGVVLEVAFQGGCHGNTQGIASLCQGRTVEDVCRVLDGIDCRGKGTSCPDQVSRLMNYVLKTK